MAAICRGRRGRLIHAGQVIFTQTTTWTAPFTGYIDIFCVGGGGGGGASDAQANSNEWFVKACSGAGGCSGKTKTVLRYYVVKGRTYTIVVGAGGAKGIKYTRNGLKGGKSSFSYGSIVICEADGGDGGTTNGIGSAGYTPVKVRGRGGSAGGSICSYYNTSMWFPAVDGSEDGANTLISRNGAYTDEETRSYGQGTTTRSFAESTGTLFAKGGATGSAYVAYGTHDPTYVSSTTNKTPQTPNTGNGGNGADASVGLAYAFGFNESYDGQDGCTGAVIIRWKEKGD